MPEFLANLIHIVGVRRHAHHAADANVLHRFINVGLQYFICLVNIQTEFRLLLSDMEADVLHEAESSLMLFVLHTQAGADEEDKDDEVKMVAGLGLPASGRLPAGGGTGRGGARCGGEEERLRAFRFTPRICCGSPRSASQFNAVSGVPVKNACMLLKACYYVMANQVRARPSTWFGAVTGS